MTEGTPFPVALQRFAADQADAPAVTDGTGTWTYAELWEHAAGLAAVLAERGVSKGDIVAIVLPTDRTLLLTAVATWILGATPQPLSPRLPAPELAAIVDVTKPALVVDALPAYTADAALCPPLQTSPSWKAPTSGGSTGRPKVILSAVPAVVERVAPLAAVFQLTGDDVVLLTAPMHHNAPFQLASTALLLGAHAVVAGRFDAERTLQLIQEHRATWVYMVPTMMTRILKLPDDVRASYDLSSLKTLMHMAAPCPQWVKQAWIDWIGAPNVWELYAGTEGMAGSVINGVQWLAHRGSVGPVVVGEMQVLDDDGNPVELGTVGEIWMRGAEPTYTYLGATAKARADGWESLGDLGYFDADGFLYLCDRLTDMVLVGGMNIYPAEVESVLEEHPSVSGAVVIGLPDEDLGNRLHALVNVNAEVADDELREWCASRVVAQKVPRTFERVVAQLRDDAAKVRRSALRAERL